MKYYKAVEIGDKPFIQWHGWADSFQKLIAQGDEENPLVKPEDELPEYIFGVCPLKIVDGELVERTVLEMETFEVEFEIENTKTAQISTINDINSGTFSYGANRFPMYEAARLRYMAIALDSTSGDSVFMNVEGLGIMIIEANLPAFLTAYHKQLQLYTNTLES